MSSTLHGFCGHVAIFMQTQALFRMCLNRSGPPEVDPQENRYRKQDFRFRHCRFPKGICDEHLSAGLTAASCSCLQHCATDGSTMHGQQWMGYCVPIAPFDLLRPFRVACLVHLCRGVPVWCARVVACLFGASVPWRACLVRPCRGFWCVRVVACMFGASVRWRAY